MVLTEDQGGRRSFPARPALASTPPLSGDFVIGRSIALIVDERNNRKRISRSQIPFILLLAANPRPPTVAVPFVFSDRLGRRRLISDASDTRIDRKTFVTYNARDVKRGNKGNRARALEYPGLTKLALVSNSVASARTEFTSAVGNEQKLLRLTKSADCRKDFPSSLSRHFCSPLRRADSGFI